MDGIVGRFWWAGDGERRSIHWLSKETLQQSKRSGGLGFKNFEDFNCSFLAKMGWRILTQPEALWVRLLKALYFPKCEFLSAKKGSSPSWLWSSILCGRLSLVKGCRKNIGNGDETWLSDPWRPDTEDFRCSLPHAIDFKVSEFIVKPDRVWDRQKLRSVFSEEVVMQIVMIPLAPQSFRDRWIWHHDKRGRFSIKSVYNALETNRCPAPRDRMQSREKDWKWLWKLSLPPKVSFFLWKLCRDAIATRMNLFRRNCAPDDECPVCRGCSEGWHHLMFQCTVARGCWEKTFPSLILPAADDDLLTWLKRNDSEPPDIIQAIAFTLWNLWKLRNAVVFRGETPSIEAAEAMLSYDVRMWRLASEPAAVHVDSSRDADVPVTQPPANFGRKLTCDGSFVDDIQKAGIAVIMYGRATTTFCRAAIVAEAEAILKAVEMVEPECDTCVIISDCKTLVDAIHSNPQSWPWECCSTIAAIRERMDRAPHIGVYWQRRENVRDADRVARMVRENRLPPNWLALVNSIPV